MIFKKIQKNRISRESSVSLSIQRPTRMVIYCYSLADLGRSLRRSLIVTFLAGIAIVSGIIPEFSWTTARICFNSSAYTQDLTDAQIRSYARSVLSIENKRQQAFQAISRILGRTPPPIACDRRDSFKDLPADAQRIAVDYCNTSKKIVENSGLTPAQFNAITTRLRTDEKLKKRIQEEILRARREGN
jgi:hypothetical protein